MTRAALPLLGRLWLALILVFLYAPILVMAAMSMAEALSVGDSHDDELDLR